MFVEMWDTFFIHFVYISCIHLVQFLYAKCISFEVKLKAGQGHAGRGIVQYQLPLTGASFVN